MSSSIFSTSITFVLLSILSLSTAFIVDTDGDLVQNGRDYYIIPVNTTSGLTYTQKQKKCPLYITPEKAENSPGTPVKFSSPILNLYLFLGQVVSLTFQGPTPCGKSLEWGQTLDPLARKLYFTAGGESTLGGGFFFSSSRDSTLKHIYELKYAKMSSSNVGLYEDDGLLGITEYPTMVSFKKAFNVLELSTS